MRIKTLLFLTALLLHLPISSQDSNYPTLAAIENLRVPPFDYVDMVNRFSSPAAGHIPPATPPEYEIGDRRVLHLSFDDDWSERATEMDLRGQSPRVLIWAQSSLDYPVWRANALAKRMETEMLNPVQKLFDFSEPAGVDGDPRLHIAMINSPDADRWGYFDSTKTRPKNVDPRSDALEMVVVNLAGDEEIDFFDEILLGTVAHEYLHALQFHSDPGEEWWLSEALSTYVDYYITNEYFSRSSWHFDSEEFLAAPNTGLTQWYSVEDTAPKYGAGYLFALYLVERFGEDILAPLLVEEANGWRAIQIVLRDYTDISAETIFADWVLANYFLDARRGYGYRALAGELERPEPSAEVNSFPATYESALPQYSTDYIAVDVGGADKLRLRLKQAAEARLIDAAVSEGDFFAYAVTSEESNSRLTRAFKLDTFRQTRLQFRIWYDLDDALEYAYVSISEDDGETWSTLQGNFTDRSKIYGRYYKAGYTGRVRYWRNESIDLSKYAPGEVLIRFEIMSDYGTLYRGLAIDDLRIGSIDYHEDFKSPDESWVAEGWIFTDNRLPNNTWLQVVQDTRDGLHISRSLIKGSGELTVDLLPGVSQVLVAVSPVVPITSWETEYSLELSLFDAAGAPMTEPGCTVTTTHALNFRDAPNGNKIGLVPKAAALDAFDRQGDWFKVEHAGRQGWIHADYVRTAGNCP